MQPAVLIRLRPLGPWRYGPGEGGRHHVDTLYRSDRLFSALTLAFADLGRLDAWLDATARASEPLVRFTSLFPFQADTLYVIPPRTAWPPAPSRVASPSPVFQSKLRWSSARFVPASLIQSLLLGQPVLADQWAVDAESECLLRRDRPSSSPFRHMVRRRAPVDRLSHRADEAHTSACIEFDVSAGLWLAVVFSNAAAAETWMEPLHGAFRLLADTGFGAGRRIGWGQSSIAAWETGNWPALLLPRLRSANHNNGTSLHWLLSLYSPTDSDTVDWSVGDYRLAQRGGRVESAAGLALEKRWARMITEGSVVSASAAPVGRAVDVAPGGHPHPVYRSGFAVSIPLPEIGPEPEILLPVEPPVEAVPEESTPPVEAVPEESTPPVEAVPEESTPPVEAVPETEPPIELPHDPPPVEVPPENPPNSVPHPETPPAIIAEVPAEPASPLVPGEDPDYEI